MMVLYFQINAVLAVSYLLFSLQKDRNPKFQLRLGQRLLMLSLLLPLLLAFLPARSVPRLPDKILAPLSEVGDSIVSSTITTKTGSRPVSQVTHMEGTAYLSWFLPVGIAGFALWLLLQAVRLLRVLWGGTSFRKLGRVSIILSSEVQVPFSTLVGGRAWVVLPTPLIGNWSDFKLAVRHELQHHRQGDTLWALAIEIVSIFFLFNPFIYLWKRRIHELQELSCDEALIGRKISSYEYGSCLVRVAETALDARPMWAGTASMAAGFGNPTYFKSFLRRRIEMLANYSKKGPIPKGLWLSGTLVLCLTTLVAYAAQQLQRSDISPGNLAIDAEIQKIADSALAAALKRYKADGGFVVVSDPRTGQILAASPQAALTQLVAPASIAKAIFAAAAIDKGLTTREELHNCEKGGLVVSGRTFYDWKGFDRLTTEDTVVHSSNLCGIKIGQKLGMAGMYQALKDYGFTEVPSTEGADEGYYVGTVATGNNGFYVTPAQIVRFFGAIANGGTLFNPERRVLSKETSDKMKGILKNVLEYGTAMKSKSKLYNLAGKTATGYIHGDDGPNTAAFVGFGPVEDPRVVIHVGILNPTDSKGAHGASHAAPVFREVAERTLQYFKVPSLE